MSGHMFNRQSWYRSIGFQEQWFRDSFRQRGLRDCVGAFVGTCDAAVADWLGRRLQTREASPDFAYWVTLNSHLPLPVPSGLPQAASCAITSLLSTQPTFCSWYQLVANVHDSLARLAMGELGRPTVFVIVGDHAPPFANPVLRTQFSGAEVPYVLLVPRQDNRAANDR
jgi:phosphoglycerol transferase MdoB-like AlkP superfamily enzyme